MLRFFKTSRSYRRITFFAFLTYFAVFYHIDWPNLANFRTHLETELENLQRALGKPFGKNLYIPTFLDVVD